MQIVGFLEVLRGKYMGQINPVSTVEIFGGHMVAFTITHVEKNGQSVSNWIAFFPDSTPGKTSFIQYVSGPI